MVLKPINTILGILTCDMAVNLPRFFRAFLSWENDGPARTGVVKIQFFLQSG